MFYKRKNFNAIIKQLYNVHSKKLRFFFLFYNKKKKNEILFKEKLFAEKKKIK